MKQTIVLGETQTTMDHIIILIILTVVSTIFLIGIRLKGKKSESLSFLSTMIATLFGVLVAITLSNIEDEKKEISDTIKLLNSGLQVLEVTYTNTHVLSNWYIDIQQDSSKNEDYLEANRLSNPLPNAVQLETIIASEIVSKNVSEGTLIQFYAGLFNIQKHRNYEDVEFYKEQLKGLHVLIQFEIAYLQGKISLEELISLDKSKIVVEEIELPYNLIQLE